MKPHRKKFNPYSTQSRTKALEMEEEAVRMIKLKQLKEHPEQLPCGDTVCRLPHERVYRGCDECVYNKTN